MELTPKMAQNDSTWLPEVLSSLVRKLPSRSGDSLVVVGGSPQLDLKERWALVGRAALAWHL